jgi:hypothetical protein
MPQVAIIDVAGPKLPPVINIEQLTCGKPGDEVFSHEIAELVRQREEFDAEDLVDGMMAFETEAVDIHDLIQTVGKTEGTRKEVLDYLATKNREKIS